MIQVIIPAAGEGKRFADAGYSEPKPFIDVCGKPMIKRVIQSLPQHNKIVVVAQQKHLRYTVGNVEYSWEFALTNLTNAKCEVVRLEGSTDGQLITVIEGALKLSRDAPLLVVNSDQILDCSLEPFLNECRLHDYIGGIVTFPAFNDPKYSYARGYPIVECTAEKNPISKDACAGFFYFKTVGTFLRAADRQLQAGDRTNGEYYLAPVYNYLGKGGIFNYRVPKESLISWGTPEELESYVDATDTPSSAELQSL